MLGASTLPFGRVVLVQGNCKSYSVEMERKTVSHETLIDPAMAKKRA